MLISQNAAVINGGEPRSFVAVRGSGTPAMETTRPPDLSMRKESLRVTPPTRSSTASKSCSTSAKFSRL